MSPTGTPPLSSAGCWVSFIAASHTLPGAWYLSQAGHRRDIEEQIVGLPGEPGAERHRAWKIPDSGRGELLHDPHPGVPDAMIGDRVLYFVEPVSRYLGGQAVGRPRDADRFGLGREVL